MIVNLSPAEYVAANLLFVTLLVGSYFFARRGPKQPTVLNLNNPPTKPEEKTPATLVNGSASPPVKGSASPHVRNFSRTEYRPRQAPQRAVTGQQGPEVMSANAAIDENEKALNILFNWNGHTWDAFEVLSVPAGSSRVAVQRAYELKRTQVDAESIPFITAAYHAIIKQI